jgi:FkbM family methyltransferase
VGLLNIILGKKNFQTLFGRMHRLSLKGMNYGRASDYVHNGEEVALRKIRDWIDAPSPILFDVGANKGEFTKRIIETWGSRPYKLYAFEPSAKTFEILKTAVHPSSSVHLINLGLGERKESVELFYDKTGSGLASVYQRDLAFRSIDFTAHEAINLTTLDSFCQENGIAKIDFLKLDVEGHELAVLKGGRKMFETGGVRMVQFEFGGCNIDSRTFFKDYFNFFAKDFILYRILSNGLEGIDKYSENLEVFQSANYLAIKK